MNLQGRDFLLSVIAAMAAMTPALAQDATPAPGIASIPQMSGTWAHPFLNALELPPSGPGPVRNKARRTGAHAGTSSIYQLVGDYANPILQPWAAEVVKKLGDRSLAGGDFPTPRNQCWPEQVPFVFINYGMELLQQPDAITILYPFDHQFRHVRLNEPHPAHVTPSWYGDSVGRYEGDTLVIDTVGVKVGRFSMIDWFGRPFTAALHLVERYRLLDYADTIKAIERAAKEHAEDDTPYNGPAVDPDYKGPGLQMQLTVTDEGAFTMPWTAAITFRHSVEEWRERVCAENNQWNPGTQSAIPTADKPDF